MMMMLMMMTTYHRPPPLFPDHFKVTPVNRGEWEVGRPLLFTRSNIHDFEMGWRGGQWESYLLRERQAVKEGDGEDHQIGAHFSNLHIPTATFNTDRTNLCVLKSWNPLHFQTLPKWNMFSRHIFILQTTKQTHVWLLIKCLKMGKLLQPWQFHASSPTEAGIQVPFADSGFSGLAQRIIQIYLAAGFGDKSSTFYQTLGLIFVLFLHFLIRENVFHWRDYLGGADVVNDVHIVNEMNITAFTSFTTFMLFPTA